MRIAACDDDRNCLAELACQLRALPRAEEVSCFSSLEAFLLCVEGGRRFDAVLMDIDWDGRETGLDVAERLGYLCPKTKVIFVTGYNDRFSQQIFLRRANLSGLLVKPVEQKLLAANLEKIADGPLLREDPALTVRSRGSMLSFPLGEILFLEGSGHHVTIHTLAESVTIYEQLDALCRSLPEGFYRCHKSFVVNMAHIRRFQRPDILLQNGAKVPVSRARYAQAKAAYFTYMGETF